ncbi:hypothetical protein YC2023_025892 [Brassica napus]
MCNSAFIVSIVLMIIVSPTFHAKTVCSITCAMMKHKVKPCLQGVRQPGEKPTEFCCNAIYSLNLKATTTQARRYLCQCFKDAIKSYPYIKIIDFPALCDVPLAIPFTPSINCQGISLIEFFLNAIKVGVFQEISQIGCLLQKKLQVSQKAIPMDEHFSSEICCAADAWCHLDGHRGDVIAWPTNK